MTKLRRDTDDEKNECDDGRFDSAGEVPRRLFDEMEDEYEGQELKGTQVESESLSFSEVFDYDTYDYDG